MTAFEMKLKFQGYVWERLDCLLRIPSLLFVVTLRNERTSSDLNIGRAILLLYDNMNHACGL